MRNIRALTIVLIILFALTSCSTNELFISSVDENGMSIASNEDEIRVNFLKDVEPVTTESTEELIVNVLDYGAVGDGVTNDTKACQTAIRKTNQGGTLYFPAGTYLLSRQLFIYGDNVTIKGDGNATKLIYEREQKTIDAIIDVSLFGARNGATNITIRDMYMEYRGEFFPKFGDSYTGKINGLYFTEIHDLLVENVEITGFNSSGINLAGLSNAYATDIVVRDCYLHHNRVGGVLYGFVDGLLITDSIMEHMGSSLDGGTGYGSAGYSGAYPKNVRVINNECNFNQRKGIDLHAGENIIIEGNTCKANRLYGIYVEGPKSNHVIIKNNFISDMDREKLDIGAPYTWNMAISIGTASNDPNKFFDYQVVGNVIENYGLGSGAAYGIYGYFSFTKGKVIIKDNIMHCNEVDNFISFTAGSVSNDTDVNFVIEGNQMYAKTLANNGIQVSSYNTLLMNNNMFNIERQSSGRPIYVAHDKKYSSTVINLNNIACGNIKQNLITLSNRTDADSIVFENNIYNGVVQQ